ncbi:hypothetical protein BJF80_16110 [Serinicoccus sp. CUA-874]|nr:phosphotransferase [Serinicoccus sp. CUA-874]OLT18270.1 hypothetical protein BJF80_16110 [Serinicoccus sp. CUA-874]
MAEHAKVHAPARAVDDPVLELLLDPERLSALLRTPVRVTRVRPKTGVSHTAALVDGTGTGWVQVLVGESRAKGVKARDRAERYGLGHLVRTVPLPQWDAELLWGGIATDPALAAPLRRSGLDLGADGLRVLRYNPLRRVVVRDGEEVVRISAARHRDDMVAVAHALHDRGVAVVTPLDGANGSDRRGGRVSRWPWVEGEDLATLEQRCASLPSADPGRDDVLDHVAAAGAVAARLHAVPVSAVPRWSIGHGKTCCSPPGGPSVSSRASRRRWRTRRGGRCPRCRAPCPPVRRWCCTATCRWTSSSSGATGRSGSPTWSGPASARSSWTSPRSRPSSSCASSTRQGRTVPPMTLPVPTWRRPSRRATGRGPPDRYGWRRRC